MPQAAGANEITSANLSSLQVADVYILGEVHDNPFHHENQALAVAAIRPKALVFEMLSPENAQAGQDADRSDAAALDAALGWSETQWPDFALYFPIFQTAPDARIYGAALPIKQVRGAIKTGAAQQFGADAAHYGLTAPLDKPEQQTREADQASAHCNALPQEMLPGMVAAQRLRDAGFARTALQALDETGGPVVVITGNGHARVDWGMARFIGRVSPQTRVLSVGQLAGDADDPPFDVWLRTPPAPDKDDPCAAFQSN